MTAGCPAGSSRVHASGSSSLWSPFPFGTSSRPWDSLSLFRAVSWDPLASYLGAFVPLGFLGEPLGPFRSQAFDFETLFDASWRFPGTHGSPVCGLLETSWVHWVPLKTCWEGPGSIFDYGILFGASWQFQGTRWLCMCVLLVCLMPRIA